MCTLPRLIQSLCLQLGVFSHLVSHLLNFVDNFSKQNALKTYGVSHNLGEANLLTVFIFFRHAFDRSPAIFLPGRWSSNTFDIGFESACSATCIGVTHQDILSHAYDKLDIR